MPTSTGSYKGYTCNELEKIALYELGQIAGSSISYARFPRWLLRQKLTERQNLIVSMSQCIRKSALIPLVEDRRTYKVPENCMDGGVIRARFYDTATTYDDLDIRDEKWMDENREGWRTEDASTPEIIFPGPTYGNTQTVSVHPIPDDSGNSYADNLDTGVYLGSDLPASAQNITGSCDSAGDSTTLNDSTSDFTEFGLVAGMAVRNLTDGSVGKLLTIADHQLVLESALTGGTDNTFANTDEYMLLSGEYAVVCQHNKPDRYIYPSVTGMLENLTIPAYTLFLEYLPYPAAFPFDPDAADAAQGWDDMYPEVPRAYHYALAIGIVADLLRTFNEQSAEFKRADAYEGQFKALAGTAMQRKFSRPFEDPGAVLVPRRKGR